VTFELSLANAYHQISSCTRSKSMVAAQALVAPALRWVVTDRLMPLVPVVMATHGARKGNVRCAMTCSAVQAAVKNFPRRCCLLFVLVGLNRLRQFPFTSAVLDCEDGIADAMKSSAGGPKTENGLLRANHHMWRHFSASCPM